MQTVKVRLRKPNRVFTFLCNGIPLQRNDPCIVRSDRGLEFGVCVLPPDDCDVETQKRFKMTVVRRANHHDLTTFKQIQYDEDRVRRICHEKIRERDLPMKLVESEYTFDRRKVIFYFTADDRVDFRELVRDLAQELKARIELRHIQVRDEAKMVGGIGTCGRELCCTTWLGEFMPISMKMAKRQNLSLNPTKISGQCGRLMCCLSYENDQYGKAKRGARPAPSAEHLAAVRDEMEHDGEKSARVIEKRDRRDGKPRAEPPARKEGRTPDVQSAKVHAFSHDKHMEVINAGVDQVSGVEEEAVPLGARERVQPAKPPIDGEAVLKVEGPEARGAVEAPAEVAESAPRSQEVERPAKAGKEATPVEGAQSSTGKRKRRRRKKNRGGPKTQ